MPLNQRDASTLRTKALPNGAASVVSSPIDLGHSQPASFLADCEAIVEAPLLTTAELPDGATMNYAVEHDWDANFSAPQTLGIVASQVGAGGAGAAAASGRIRLPSNVARHVRLKATNSGAGNASGKSASIILAF